MSGEVARSNERANSSPPCKVLPPSLLMQKEAESNARSQKTIKGASTISLQNCNSLLNPERMDSHSDFWDGNTKEVILSLLQTIATERPADPAAFALRKLCEDATELERKRAGVELADNTKETTDTCLARVLTESVLNVNAAECGLFSAHHIDDKAADSIVHDSASVENKVGTGGAVRLDQVI